MLKCERCNKQIEDGEYVDNWGWCDMCFNTEYECYIESVAGPFDWIVN